MNEFYCQLYFMNSYIDIVVVTSCEVIVEGFILKIINMQTFQQLVW